MDTRSRLVNEYLGRSCSNDNGLFSYPGAQPLAHHAGYHGVRSSGGHDIFNIRVQDMHKAHNGKDRLIRERPRAPYPHRQGGHTLVLHTVLVRLQLSKHPVHHLIRQASEVAGCRRDCSAPGRNETRRCIPTWRTDPAPVARLANRVQKDGSRKGNISSVMTSTARFCTAAVHRLWIPSPLPGCILPVKQWRGR